MPTLVELATQLVAAQAAASPMSTEDILGSLDSIHSKLKQLESGATAEETPAPAAQVEQRQISFKEAFKKNEVVCMVCGKGGFKTLARHLSTAHGMKPREYKKQFGIPATTALAAKSYSESRRQMAKDRDLAGNLAKAREVRATNLAQKAVKPAKAAKGTKAPAKAPAKPVAKPAKKATSKAPANA